MANSKVGLFFSDWMFKNGSALVLEMLISVNYTDFCSDSHMCIYRQSIMVFVYINIIFLQLKLLLLVIVLVIVIAILGKIITICMNCVNHYTHYILMFCTFSSFDCQLCKEQK